MDLEITKVPIIQITKGSSVIEVPSSNNEIGIASGTLRLKRSIVDTDIAFGEPIASEFSVELFNIEEDLQGCPIQVFLEDRSGTSYTRTAIFTGVIDSSKTDNIGHTRQIVAYDWIYYHRNDNMADWWNNYWEPATGYVVKGVRDDFLEYLGFTAPTREYVNDYNTHISWSNADLPIVTTITFAQIIRMFCEIQGTFPYIDGSGNLDFAVLDNSVTTDLRGEYESYNSNWEDFVTDTITGIAVYSSSEDLLTMVGTDDNVYNIAGNIWLMHLEEYYHENVVETLTRLLGVISNIQYKPCQLKMIKTHNGLVLGQRVQTDKGYTYVMSEELYGVCFVEQTIEAKASASQLSGEVNNINDTMVQANKISRVEKTIDGLTTEISAINTDLQNNHYTKTETDSKITQSATSILTTVSETYTTKSNAIKTDTLHYLATSAGSGVTKDTPGWTTTVQSVTSTNKYLWTYHTYTYADDTQATPHTSDTTPVITGVYGDQGQQGPQGTTGTGVSSVTPLYYAGSSTPSKPTSAVTSTSTSGGQWTKAIPSLSTTYPNLYTCDQVYYTNGTYSWSDVVSDINSTTSYSEINQLKDKIVLKVDNSGKIVQVALSANASTGSEFKVKADNIDFIANGVMNLTANSLGISSTNFSIDKTTGNVTINGSVTCNDGKITITNSTDSATGIIKAGNVSIATYYYFYNASTGTIEARGAANIRQAVIIDSTNYLQVNKATNINGHLTVEGDVNAYDNNLTAKSAIIQEQVMTTEVFATTKVKSNKYNLYYRYNDTDYEHTFIEARRSQTNIGWILHGRNNNANAYFQSSPYDLYDFSFNGSVGFGGSAVFGAGASFNGNTSFNDSSKTLSIVTSAGTITKTELGYLSGATSNIQGQIDGLGAKSVNGNPVVITDAEAMNADEVIVTLTPKQDFNGYDSAWIGGEGKNKYSILIGDDSFNTNGGASFSRSNGILIINATANNASGVYTNSYSTMRILPANYASGISVTYSFFIKASNADTRVRIGYENFGLQYVTIGTSWQRVTVTVTADGNGHNFVAYNYSGSAVEIQIRDFMFEVGSTAHDYEPYENICPVSGQTQSTVNRYGKNVFDDTNITNASYNKHNIPNTLKPNTTYRFTAFNDTSYKYRLLLASSNGASPSSYTAVTSYIGTGGVNFTTPNNTDDYPYLCLQGNSSGAGNADVKFNITVGTEIQSSYEPYQGTQITIQFGQTIYGGTVNYSTGVATLTWIVRNITWLAKNNDNFFWSNQLGGLSKARDYTIKCDKAATSPNGSSVGVFTDTWRNFCIRTSIAYENASDCLEDYGGSLQVCFELATPQTIQLTPKQIELLLNNNTLTTDADSLDITYQTNNGVGDTTSALDKRVASLENSRIYSTTEKIVGTWIDGKPIYQKTFTGTVTSTSSARTYIVIEDLSSYNINDYLGSEGIIKDGTVWKTLNVADTYNCSIAYDTNGKKLNVLIANWGQGESFDYIITIRYTKTS